MSQDAAVHKKMLDLYPSDQKQIVEWVQNGYLARDNDVFVVPLRRAMKVLRESQRPMAEKEIAEFMRECEDYVYKWDPKWKCRAMHLSADSFATYAFYLQSRHKSERAKFVFEFTRKIQRFYADISTLVKSALDIARLEKLQYTVKEITAAAIRIRTEQDELEKSQPGAARKPLYGADVIVLLKQN
jgi:hypothetical protein